MSNMVALVVGAAMVAAGPVIFFNNIRNQRRAAEAKTLWPRTAGKVTDFRVIEYRRSHGVRLKYSYSVGGKEYESNRLSFFGVHTGDEAYEFAERFPVGSDPTVMYDPKNPSIAVLVPGVYGKNRSHGIAMAFLISLAGAGVIAAQIS